MDTRAKSPPNHQRAWTLTITGSYLFLVASTSGILLTISSEHSRDHHQIVRNLFLLSSSLQPRNRTLCHVSSSLLRCPVAIPLGNLLRCPVAISLGTDFTLCAPRVERVVTHLVVLSSILNAAMSLSISAAACQRAANVTCRVTSGVTLGLPSLPVIVRITPHTRIGDGTARARWAKHE